MSFLAIELRPIVDPTHLVLVPPNPIIQAAERGDSATNNPTKVTTQHTWKMWPYMWPVNAVHLPRTKVRRAPYWPCCLNHQVGCCSHSLGHLGCVALCPIYGWSGEMFVKCKRFCLGHPNFSGWVDGEVSVHEKRTQTVVVFLGNLWGWNTTQVCGDYS